MVLCVILINKRTLHVNHGTLFQGNQKIFQKNGNSLTFGPRLRKGVFITEPKKFHIHTTMNTQQ